MLMITYPNYHNSHMKETGNTYFRIWTVTGCRTYFVSKSVSKQVH